MKTKVCSKCKQRYPLNDFNWHKGHRDGYRSECKGCTRKSSKLYYEKNRKQCNRVSETWRRNHTEQFRLLQRKTVLRQYGMTVNDYDQLFAKQKGRCAICGRHQLEFHRHLNVDHDHITGIVRGLLCTECNNLLGQLEKTGFVAKALDYREK